jgi:hypothetical protein
VWKSREFDRCTGVPQESVTTVFLAKQLQRQTGWLQRSPAIISFRVNPQDRTTGIATLNVSLDYLADGIHSKGRISR